MRKTRVRIFESDRKSRPNWYLRYSAEDAQPPRESEDLRIFEKTVPLTHRLRQELTFFRFTGY